jgi:hypothetical protein
MVRDGDRPLARHVCGFVECRGKKVHLMGVPEPTSL